MEQQTKEWHELRKQKIGASDAPAIMGVSPWKTKLQLWEEKVGLRESNYKSQWMERGIKLEEAARKSFMLMTGIDVAPSIVISKEYDFMMASLDGLSQNGRDAVEIKCPGANDHALALLGIIPDKYLPQLQHQMIVCELDSIYYFSFDGQNGTLIKVKRDDIYCNGMIENEKDFFRRIKEFQPPEATEKDYARVDCPNAIAKAQRIKQLKAQANELQKEADMLLDELTSETGFQSCDFGGVCKLSKVIRKGAISYSDIPELKVIDLEQYRKQPSTFMRLS
jgi:putative phage-type endonuclease